MTQHWYQKASVQVAIVPAVAAVIIAIISVVLNKGDQSVTVDVEDSPGAKTQTAINSPGATQIVADKVTVFLSPKLERTLTMEPVHVNKPVGDKFESLFRGKLEAPYPIPSLRVEAHGRTVQEVDLSPLRTGIVMHGHSGRREGYAFTTLQNAIGRLQLKVVTDEPEKLNIKFSVQE